MFADLNFTKKFVPAVFLTFCEEAKSGGEIIEGLEVDVNIKYRGKDVTNLNLKRKMSCKILKELKRRN